MHTAQVMVQDAYETMLKQSLDPLNEHTVFLLVHSCHVLSNSLLAEQPSFFNDHTNAQLQSHL